MKLTIEMYGLSPYTESNQVDLEIKDGAGLGELISALVRRIPSFEGHVKQVGRNRLVENYGLYVNGQFVDPDEQIQLKKDDRVVLLLLATGG